MKVTLLTVGKTDVPWVRQGVELYAARLSHYIKFGIVEIPELKGVSALDEAQIKEKEGKLILKAAGDARMVLLDERGKEFRSLEFAAWLQDAMGRGGRDLVFVVGGAYGFSKEVYDRASALISLSRMTFSHQMIRAIFTEQLYRACTILKGEPYHHE
ncbi:MAG: 23S rRNA (pseudouridine(1915)-N(3))-methyltransferase RlmH [Bacteroidales bacterium]|nr:23S rRNA (pseudouridine(1915)-N(3))-methyltransferase RlmH [Bacteroidales bacterium]